MAAQGARAVEAPDVRGLDRGAAVEALRRSMARIGAAPVDGFGGGGGAGAAAAVTHAEPGDRPPATTPAAAGGRALPVPEGLADVLGGCVVRGGVTSVEAAGMVVAGVVAAVTAGGGHAALVGVPELLAAPVAECGGDLSRILVVEEPGASPLEILATLADGVDLLVAALPRTPPPSLTRPLMARLRRSGAALLHVGAAWPGAVAAVSSHVAAVHGLGSGHGRIRAVEYAVAAEPAGMAPRRGTWIVGDADAVPGRGEAAAAEAADAGAPEAAEALPAGVVPLRRAR
ncbi:hypothetical protein [Corynebacterium sp. 335C]